jgi:hypothetical protein
VERVGDDWSALLSTVIDSVDGLFARVSTDGWQAAAANVGWSCWFTAEHISGDFAHYAGQVVGQARGHYVKFGFDTGRASDAEELREVVRVAGGLLVAAVQVAEPKSVAWHPHGYFTPAGYAAVACAEAIVHGCDIASGLGLDWQPEPHVCSRVLTMLFPDAAQREDESALEVLLRCTGRGRNQAESDAAASWIYGGALLPPDA